jgi:hypothetical protein
MRYFLIIVLGSLSFFAPAQSVNISTSTARYFLERDDLSTILEKKDSVNAIAIKNLNFTIDIKNKLLEQKRKDSLSLIGIIGVKDSELKTTKQEVKILKREVRKEKFLRAVTTVGLVVVTIISLL